MCRRAERRRHRKDDFHDECCLARTRGQAGALRQPARERAGRSPRAGGPALADVRQRPHGRGVADPHPEGRAQDRRRRPSRRQRLPAGDPAGADAGQRPAGDGRDHGRRPRDECRARHGERRGHEGGGAGAAPAQQRGRRGGDPRPQRRGARRRRRRRRSTPMPRSRASSCSRTTPSATAITTSRASAPR